MSAYDQHTWGDAGGPYHRPIRYFATFDLCDRETDLRLAWDAFARGALRA